MLTSFRWLVVALEEMCALPFRLLRFITQAIVFNPKLGPARHLATIAILYVTAAVLLVYVLAPLRGLYGAYFDGPKIHYDSQRWLATAIYDRRERFVGTFDARLDSKQDVNYTGVPIEVAGTDYVANPDHKSIPVRRTPDHFWRCLVYHEDRYLGTVWNPFGIDLWGVLKIPVSTLQRSLRGGGVRFGVGGSTLSMQLARIVYKTPPRRGESSLEKIRRKLREWWLAPVIYRVLTADGTDEPFRQWTANHLWLAQRTGGSDLHGVELTARVVFGKRADQLSVAEQYVLASAVNKPIILLNGRKRLNEVRIERWRYIVEVRARRCATELVPDVEKQKAILFELTSIAGGPPDPQIAPQIDAAVQDAAPGFVRQARANPALRANVLIPAARYGAREEMKQDYGFEWRNYVRGVRLTLDAARNRGFRERVKDRLAEVQKKHGARIASDYTLDLRNLQAPDAPVRRVPDVIVAAADEKGRLVRYFESKDTAAYFGSAYARDPETGQYRAERETRAIASIGKMIGAVAIANETADNLATGYLDTGAPARGLESCKRDGTLRRSRRAEVVFACSLSAPLETRLARVGQRPIRRLIDGFGFNMPPAPDPSLATPPSTAAARGFVTGSPQRVHQMAGAILAAVTGGASSPLAPPTLIDRLEEAAAPLDETAGDALTPEGIVPNRLVRPGARRRLREFLSAPLCYQFRGKRIGTLKSLGKWCAKRRRDIRVHFAKTGTQVTEDRDATVDTWVAGGVQFANGRSYSYVVVVGTGNNSEPWARRLHAAQLAAPLADVLLADLAGEERARPRIAREASVAVTSSGQ
ncbi:MAG: transglycosylase domain-containing protein [Pseudomonadota bacterium]